LSEWTTVAKFGGIPVTFTVEPAPCCISPEAEDEPHRPNEDEK
jgi:hypothetical protein